MQLELGARCRVTPVSRLELGLGFLQFRGYRLNRVRWVLCTDNSTMLSICGVLSSSAVQPWIEVWTWIDSETDAGTPARKCSFADIFTPIGLSLQRPILISTSEFLVIKSITSIHLIPNKLLAHHTRCPLRRIFSINLCSQADFDLFFCSNSKASSGRADLDEKSG